MDSRTIRDKFTAFFAERGHDRVPSASLVPNDPNLLLTNAGMNQFKPYFLGDQTAPYARAVSIQKCFRTTDIDEVGKTARHLTFFEMLGNFSFGDYYKEKACPWAWELVTDGYGFDPELLWVTIYETDDEADEIWRDAVGVRPERIVRLGKKDNFWSMGVAGPCGPDSEIFFDLGERFGEESEQGPGGNQERYLEIWNLVFMQNDCNAQIEPVAELPKKNIDTGAGVERMAFALQRAASIYETDTLGGMVARAEELTKKKYGSDEKVDKALRILADHGRGLAFLIADGVMPSNEERGYVLRRLMRRAIRHARLLGYEKQILPELIDSTVELMGDAYPEVKDRYDFIVEVAAREEDRFDETLKQGLEMLGDEITKARDLGAGIAGDVAFKLHDTFGFPIDITADIAAEAGLDVDSPAFERLMAEQRERARAARKVAPGADLEKVFGPILTDHGETDFVGYEHLSTTASVLAIGDGAEGAPVAGEGEEATLLLDRTTFYAEGGGQVGDHGVITGPSGTADVIDTVRVLPGLFGHRVRVRSGEIRVDEDVVASVDPDWRRGSERAHTATHILHWVLRDRVGEHAKQAGSLVEPGRLRFDFNHFDALGGRVQEIAGEMQSLVQADDATRAYETSFDFARSIGAMAIFGEKYGDVVRVVEVGEYSKELCGGTHVPHTSQIGVVVVTSEGSVGANLRRVEALVGQEGLDHLKRRVAILERAAEMLKTNPEEVAERIDRMLATQKEMERKAGEEERKVAESAADDLAAGAVDVNGTRLVVARREGGVDALRSLAQKLKGKLDSSVVILGTAGEANANLIAAVSKDVVGRGITARDLLAPGATLLGGGAGGKPELAISGGPNRDRLDEALEASAAAAREALSGG
jgi:alanyl-tRNA synthetase